MSWMKTFFVYLKTFTNEIMIKWLLFVFLSIGTQAFNASQCRSEGHENWLCNYMDTHNRIYTEKEVHLRKKQLSKVHPYTKDGVYFNKTSRSDRFSHELKSNFHLKLTKHLSLTRSTKNKHVHLAAPKHLTPIDWRNVGGRSYVSSVKDQGECGCCFAFASSTVLEYWSKPQGFPKSLSPQSMMDCTSGNTRPDDGCDGGLMEYIFEYAKTHPVPLEVEFPYKERGATCPNKKLLSHVKVNEYRVLMHSEHRDAESEIEWLLHSYGPVSVGVDSTNMDSYSGGIYKAHMCTTDIDHAVTIVGYTKDAWIIKNSWGPYWGENGYLYLERGKNACGVAEYIVYITDAEPVVQEMSTYWYKLE